MASSPSQLIDWTDLTCDCGSKQFVNVILKRWKPGSGTTESPGGCKCAQCGTNMDNAYLIKRAERELARQKLREVEAEVAALEEPPTFSVEK